MKTFEEYKKQQMQDPEFVKEYEAIQPEMDVIRAIVNARTSQNLTQNELAKTKDIKMRLYDFQIIEENYIKKS